MTEAQLGWDQIVAGLEAMTPEERRAVMPASHTTEDLIALFPELAAVEVHDVAIDGPHGEVPARRYRVPGEAATAGFVWAHGGGFIGGDLDMPEAHWVALMVAARGLPVLSVDYRKCLSGTRYPVPSDDVLAGWQWAVAHAGELGLAADRLHLGGASAGANLVAGVTKRLRDGAGPMPRTVVLVYPLVHGELPSFSDELAAVLEAKGGMFSADVVRAINVNFVGAEEALDDPYAFAANGDVSGQPPVLVLNSEADELRASGEAYAAELEGAGVEVALEYEPGTAHGHLNEPDQPAAVRSIERIVSWIDGRR